MAFKGLPYPVIKTPLGLFKTETGLNLLKADLLILLLTSPGERVMLSDYGTNLKQYIFDPNDSLVAQQVRQEIINAISRWEPRVVIDEITVSSRVDTDLLNKDDPREDIDHILEIRIKLFDPENIQEVDTLVIQLPQAGGRVSVGDIASGGTPIGTV